MANEIRVTSSLQIKNGNLQYLSRPTAFTADMSGDNGPTPGAIIASTDGANVNLSVLSQPGLCRVMNLDSVNYVEIGIWDPDDNTFYPLLELLPGESYVIRLSRFIQQEILGTGTHQSEVTSLRVKAIGAPCNVLIEAFER